MARGCHHGDSKTETGRDQRRKSEQGKDGKARREEIVVDLTQEDKVKEEQKSFTKFDRVKHAEDREDETDGE